MKIPRHITNNLLRIVYPVFIIATFIYTSVNALSGFGSDLLSIPNVVIIIAMFMGQFLLLTPYSIAYPLYFFSCLYGTSVSTIFWLSRVMPSIPVYLGAISILMAVPLVVHFYTRKRIQTIPMLGTFSVFLFVLLIIFGVSPTPTTSTVDTLFHVTLVLFVLISILGLNLTFRTMRLNKELRIRDVNNYRRKAKEDLLKKFTSDDAHAEIDLLIYYLSSSIESFIDGDFERSFMDAYKIAFDNHREAFKTIYVLPEAKEENGRFREIRDNLAHAHIREKKRRIRKKGIRQEAKAGREKTLP